LSNFFRNSLLAALNAVSRKVWSSSKSTNSCSFAVSTSVVEVQDLMNDTIAVITVNFVVLLNQWKVITNYIWKTFSRREQPQPMFLLLLFCLLFFVFLFISYLYQIFKIVYFRKTHFNLPFITYIYHACVVSRKYNQYLICMYLICIYVIGNEKNIFWNYLIWN
jgi:TRAP-type mannitol/chloroaromatic compound transport system permease small subunit